MKQKKAASEKRAIQAIRQFFSWIKQEKKRCRIVLAGAVLCAAGLTAVIIALVQGGKEQVTYTEAQVKYGTLSVGVEADGNISVGTTEQLLEVDISAYTGSTSYDWSSMGMGMQGMEMMAGMQGGNQASSSTASGTRQLEVAAVYVTAGQEIHQGDPLLKLTEESVEEIRSQLEEDSVLAQSAYEQQKTEQQLADLTATQELDNHKADGSQAQLTYQQTIEELETAKEQAEEALEEGKTTLTELQEEYARLQEEVPVFAKLLENAEYALATTDKETVLYLWLDAENTREEAEAMVEELEKSIEELESQITSQETQVANLEDACALAEKNLTTGKIEAQAVYDKAMITYEQAQEIYEATVGETSLTTRIVEAEWEEAKEKLEEFDSQIQENIIYAGYDGVITQVNVKAGDYIGTDSSLITLNDDAQVTVTVSLKEDEMTDIQTGSQANVYCPALPEMNFSASVQEIGDATYDNSTGTTSYEVTVLLEGDTSGLFESMTAEVTFVTEEAQDVIYVSSRAIITEEEATYVKLKDERGKVVKRQIETGFTDGIYTEIKEGLSEGETVLIESRVNGE